MDSPAPSAAPAPSWVTAPSEQRVVVAPPSDLASPDPISPDVLADLMVASALAGSADVIRLHSREEACVVELMTARRVLGRLTVPNDVGFAAAVRLAVAAGLSPPVPHGGHDGGGVARLEARVGEQTGEIVVSMGTGTGGLDLELHPLAAHGRGPSRRVYLKRCPRCGAYQPPQRTECEDGTTLIDVEDDPSVGGTIGTYRVTAVIGQGSMGTVFAAEHVLITKLVAIKVLHPSLASDVAVVRRFLREARAASRLAHPNVLEVTDFGVLSDGRPFMVMERLSGESLDQRLDRGGALPARTALLVAREIAVALEAAHAAGVVHNDLKPSNIVLFSSSTDEAPRLKLVDFGAASVAGDGDADDLTIGTPHYMAPERVVGKAADQRSDVYALGIMIFEMLHGQVPFTGGTNGAVMLAQVRQPVPRVTSPLGPLPSRVVDLLDRALAKNPGDRHPSMREMIADIDAAVSVVRRRGWRWLWAG
jgi:tRNA A-37 threonylcarbamoyl transferase component Bud32